MQGESLFDKIEKIRNEHKEKKELEYQEYCKLNPITEEHIDHLIDKTFDKILECCVTDKHMKLDFSKEYKGKPSQYIIERYVNQVIDIFIKRLKEREPKLEVTEGLYISF